jgi:uncharacterized membrane protein
MPETYTILLFLHITAVILWLGAGTMVDLLALRAERQDDPTAMQKIVDDVDSLSNTFFIPAALAALVFGILLVIDGPWSFGSLWIILGLAGFGVSFLMGVLYFAPVTKRLNGIIERDGGMSAEAFATARRMLAFGRIETVVLFLVAFDMVAKPTGGDTGTLVLMAGVLVAGIAYFARRGVAIDPARSPAG